MSSLILDVSIVVVFLIFLFIGFKSGIMNAFLSFVGTVFSALFSIYVAGKISDWIYFDLIAPSFMKKIETLISQNSLSANSVLEKFPRLLINFLPDYGITPFSLNHIIDNNAKSEIPLKISELLAPTVINILKSWFTVLLFIIFVVLTKVISKFIVRLFKSSVIKKANTLLGGIFGLFKGYVAIVICMCCLKNLLPFVQNVPEVFSDESISNTLVFKELYYNNPIGELFKNI